MDTFSEQLVKRKTAPMQILFKVLFVISTISIGALIFLLLLPILGLISFAISGLVIFLGFYLLTGLSIEYEYIVTNGSIDIDKIIAKRKRKRIITIESKSITSFGEFKNAPELKSEHKKVIVHDGIEENKFYADAKTQKFGQVRLIFSPNEKTIRNINPYLSRSIKYIK